MVRISHRTKFYKNQYISRCVVFGMFMGWGESMVVWWTRTFDVPLGEVMSCNLFGLISGGIAGIIAAFIGILVFKLIEKRNRLDREIHRTAWTFSFASSLIVLGLMLGKILDDFSLLRLIITLLLPPIAYVAIYLFSKKYFFKFRHAGRITLEIILVIFLAAYFIKRPSTSREIAPSGIKYPHIMVFDIDYLEPTIEAEVALKETLPEKMRPNLNIYANAIPPFQEREENVKAFFAVPGAAGETSMAEMLKKQNYHLGSFWMKSAPESKLIDIFDAVDDQTYSLKSRLTPAQLVSHLIPFVRFNHWLNRRDGFNSSGERTGEKLVESVIFWLNHMRDNNPIYTFIKYPAIAGDNEAVVDNSRRHLSELFERMERMGLTDESIFFFTSTGGEENIKPLMIYSADWTYGDNFHRIAVSLSDVNATILHAAFGKITVDTGTATSLRDMADGDYSTTRSIYTWETLADEGKPATAVYYFPWKLNREGDETLILSKFDNGAYLPIAPEKSDAPLSLLKDLLDKPRFMEYALNDWVSE